MYLGYQQGKIKFYTKELLQSEIYNLDKVVETQEEYVLSADGTEYVFKDEAWESIQFERAKQKRIAENDRLRDEKLNGGVEYQGVLFDSDTDQKVNLLATISVMSDIDTIIWYGMDNKALLCAKEDLINIGGLITELHSYCWNMNAYVKEQIEEAKTIAELDIIKINYTLKEN